MLLCGRLIRACGASREYVLTGRSLDVVRRVRVAALMVRADMDVNG